MLFVDTSNMNLTEEQKKEADELSLWVFDNPEDAASAIVYLLNKVKEINEKENE